MSESLDRLLKGEDFPLSRTAEEELAVAANYREQARTLAEEAGVLKANGGASGTIRAFQDAANDYRVLAAKIERKHRGLPQLPEPINPLLYVTHAN